MFNTSDDNYVSNLNDAEPLEPTQSRLECIQVVLGLRDFDQQNLKHMMKIRGQYQGKQTKEKK